MTKNQLAFASPKSSIQAHGEATPAGAWLCAAGHVLLPSLGAQLAGWAYAAAVAPAVANVSRALVACVGLLENKFHQRLAAQVLRHLPGLGLVYPHQRRGDAQAALQAQVQRDLQGFHGVVAAVGIAREIGFTDTGDDHLQPASVGERTGQREEQQIAPGHESVGQAVGLHRKRHVVGQRRAADLLQHVERQHVVLAQARRPLRKLAADLGEHVLARIEFDMVALTVIETQGFDAFITRKSVGKAGGGVLSTGKKDQGGSVHGGH